MMLAIADFAHDDGTAYPSNATLARKSRMSVRNARYVLDRLELSGELAIERNTGPKGCNVYRIKIKQPLQAAAAPLQPIAPLQAAAAPLQQPSATPAAGFLQPLQPIAPEPLLNRQEPSRARAARAGPVQLKTFLEACKQRCEQPIPENSPVFALAAEKGIPESFIALAWREFKRHHLPGGTNDQTKKQDWRKHFRNAVDRNWYHLWTCKPDGSFELISAGREAMNLHRQAA